MLSADANVVLVCARTILGHERTKEQLNTGGSTLLNLKDSKQALVLLCDGLRMSQGVYDNPWSIITRRAFQAVNGLVRRQADCPTISLAV